jgi:hypothetical protein
VTRISELGTTLAATSNQCTLQRNTKLVMILHWPPRWLSCLYSKLCHNCFPRSFHVQSTEWRWWQAFYIHTSSVEGQPECSLSLTLPKAKQKNKLLGLLVRKRTIYFLRQWNFYETNYYEFV